MQMQIQKQIYLRYMYLTYWARLLRNQEDFDESSFHFMQRKHLYSSEYSALALLDNSALNQYHAWFAAWNRFGRKIGNRNFLSEDRLKFCKKGRIFKYLRHFSHEIDFFGFNRTLIISFFGIQFFFVCSVITGPL